MTESLLSRAGLRSSDTSPGKDAPKRDKRNDSGFRRYDLLDNSAGQIDSPDKPV